MSAPRHIRLAVLFALLVPAVAALGACSAQPVSQPVAQGSAAATPTAADQPQTPGEEPLHVSTVKPTGSEVAVIKTNKGVIKFTFFPKDASNTVASFIELTDKGFYNGTKWHRVVPGFVIQGGDPLSKTLPAGDQRIGTGDPGYRLKAEFNSRKHIEGSVAMARSQDPDSAGSQFYICLAPQPSLDGQYTVFGQVTSGLDVVHKIAQGDVIESVTIQRGK